MRWCRQVAHSMRSNGRDQHLAAQLKIGHVWSAVVKIAQKPDAGLLNQGPATPNGRHHIICGSVHHSVCAHLCLRLGAGSEICSQLSSQSQLLDPILRSDLNLHAKPIGISRRIRRVQRTKGWPLCGSNIRITSFGP